MLEVTFMAQMGEFRVGYSASYVRQCIGCALLCLSEGEPYICKPQKPSGPNLLDEPLKDFIVNPADLPWKWVKRLITSGERVNHGSWVKMYNICKVLKIDILAVLTVTSGLGSLLNR